MHQLRTLDAALLWAPIHECLTDVLLQNPSTVDDASLINNDNAAALGGAAYDWAKARR